jgi:hypothetical protein
VVETEAGSEKQGHGQLGGPLISVVAGSLDVDGKSSSRNSSQHTIEFSVPMHFQLRWLEESRKSGKD